MQHHSLILIVVCTAVPWELHSTLSHNEYSTVVLCTAVPWELHTLSTTASSVCITSAELSSHATLSTRKRSVMSKTDLMGMVHPSCETTGPEIDSTSEIPSQSQRRTGESRDCADTNQPPPPWVTTRAPPTRERGVHTCGSGDSRPLPASPRAHSQVDWPE